MKDDYISAKGGRRAPSVHVSLRKMEIYERRGGRSTGACANDSSKEGGDVSSMEEASRMMRLIDPNFEKITELYRKYYVDR